MKKKYPLAMCTRDLYLRNETYRKRRAKLLCFREGRVYKVIDESLRNKLLLIDETGKRHQVSGTKTSGWFKYFIVKRRVIVEKLNKTE